MKLIAIDSSGMTASVAILEDDRLIAEYTVDYKKTHSQTLLPMLEELRQMVQLDLKSVDAVAVAAGPGSFTGLRIGSATAKGIGLALKLPLVEVPTLEGMAYNCWGVSELICPMMDARRQQVYTGVYRCAKETITVVREQMAVPLEEICRILNELAEPVILLGDGAAAFREELGRLLQVPFRFAPAHMNRQRASGVAVCAMNYLREGRKVTAAAHRPIYLRVSQAERERAARLKKEESAQTEEEETTRQRGEESYDQLP